VELGLSTDGLADDPDLADLWTDPELRVTFSAVLTMGGKRGDPLEE
jgi:hypothetical protein